MYIAQTISFNRLFTLTYLVYTQIPTTALRSDLLPYKVKYLDVWIHTTCADASMWSSTLLRRLRRLMRSWLFLFKWYTMYLWNLIPLCNPMGRGASSRKYTKFDYKPLPLFSLKVVHWEGGHNSEALWYNYVYVSASCMTITRSGHSGHEEINWSSINHQGTTYRSSNFLRVLYLCEFCE